MSSIAEIIADKADAAGMTQTEMVKRKPSGKKVYKPHIATKVKWCLEDAIVGTEDIQQIMLQILALMDEARVMKNEDTKWLVHLGKIDHQMAYLALLVTALERTITRAVAESKPEAKCK